MPGKSCKPSRKLFVTMTHSWLIAFSFVMHCFNYRHRGENMWFRPTIFIVLNLFHFVQNDTKYLSFNNSDPDLYEYAKLITFIHTEINAMNIMPNLDELFFLYTLYMLSVILSFQTSRTETPATFYSRHTMWTKNAQNN